MANDTAYMAEFADNLWNNYIKVKLNDMLRSNVSYYKATVISNPGDGTLNVQRPYDNTVNISCADDLRDISAGTLVTVLVFGKGNATNHIAVSADGMKDIRSTGGSDYVVEYGSGTDGLDTTILSSTSSRCYWQKWNSGKLEIWGYGLTIEGVYTETEFSTGYVSNDVYTCWGTWPVPFVTYPTVNVSFHTDESVVGANYFQILPKVALADGGTPVDTRLKSPYFKVWSESNEEFYLGGDFPVFTFHAVGNWK